MRQRRHPIHASRPYERADPSDVLAVHKLANLARNLVQLPRLIQVEPALGPLDVFEPAQLRFGGGRHGRFQSCVSAQTRNVSAEAPWRVHNFVRHDSGVEIAHVRVACTTPTSARSSTLLTTADTPA